jgi:DNA-directed RNA polymerase specialized sigma24 family protein
MSNQPHEIPGYYWSTCRYRMHPRRPKRPRKTDSERSRNRYDGLDPETVAGVRHKIHRLIRTSSFLWDDQPDIEQELILHLLLREHRHDPKRASRRTFISRILDNKIRHLLETRHARIRDQRCCQTSLNQEFVDDEGNVCEWLDSIVQSGKWDGPSRESRQHCAHELRLDLAVALAELSPPQLTLCRCLMFHDIAEVSRLLGVPRSTLYDRIQGIREVFDSHGLEIYR